MTHSPTSTLACDWAEHTAWVQRLVRGMIHDPDLAEDIAQDALVAGLAWRSAGPQQPRAWLRRVVSNLLAKRLRGDTNRAKREREAELELPSTPEEIAERVERQQLVAREVLALPEAYKNALLLHYYENVSIDEIARRLKVPPRTIQTRLYRARRMMRDRLASGYGKRWLGMFLPLGFAPNATAGGSALGLAEGSTGQLSTEVHRRVGRASLQVVGFVAAGIAVIAWGIVQLLLSDSSPLQAGLPTSSVSLPSLAATQTSGSSTQLPASERDHDIRREEVQVPQDMPTVVAPKPELGGVAGSVSVPDQSDLGSFQASWAIRVRRPSETGPVTQAPWPASENASIWDHDPDSPKRLMLGSGMPRPGQTEGTHAYLDGKGGFHLKPLLAGIYDLLVERNGLPVTVIRAVAVGPEVEPDPRLTKIDVRNRCRLMRLSVSRADETPLAARTILIFRGDQYYRPYYASRGTIDVYVPRASAPDVVVFHGGSRPQRIPWQDGDRALVLEPRIDVYLQAVRAVDVKKEALAMPYLLFVPQDPVLGLPPGVFGTEIDIRPLAAGKTIKVPAYSLGLYSLNQQTDVGGTWSSDLGGAFRQRLVSGILVTEPAQIQATFVALPDPVRKAKGASGSRYVRLPNRVVDLQALMAEDGR